MSSAYGFGKPVTSKREDDDGIVHVSFMDPVAVLGLVNNDNILPLADQVREKLHRVMAAI